MTDTMGITQCISMTMLENSFSEAHRNISTDSGSGGSSVENKPPPATAATAAGSHPLLHRKKQHTFIEITSTAENHQC